MKKTFFTIILMLLAIIVVFKADKAKAEYIDVKCGVEGCTYIIPSDNWAGITLISPGPILNSPSFSPSKSSYKVGDKVIMNWSMFASSESYLAYNGYEIRYSLNDGNDWIANDCLNIAPGVAYPQQDYGDIICFDNKHLMYYPDYLTKQDDSTDSNGNYIYPVYGYKNESFAIPDSWAGKTVKFQIIEKFYQGVPDTIDYEVGYLITYSSSIKVAAAVSSTINFTTKNFCSLGYYPDDGSYLKKPIGQAISSGTNYLSQLIRNYTKNFNLANEVNTGQYDSYLPVGVSDLGGYWDKGAIRNYRYQLGSKIFDQFTYKIESHLAELVQSFQISVNGSPFTNANDYVPGYDFTDGFDFYYGYDIPITSFQKDGNYTIQAGDTIQWQTTVKLTYKKCLVPYKVTSTRSGYSYSLFYGQAPLTRTDDGSGLSNCAPVYDSTGMSLGDRPLIISPEILTYQSNVETVNVLPCMIKNVKITPEKDTFKPNSDSGYSFKSGSQESFKAEVEYEPFSTFTATCGGVITKSYPYCTNLILSNHTQNFYSTENLTNLPIPMKKNISQETVNTSGWHFSTTLDKTVNSILSFDKLNSSVQANDFDLSTWYSNSHYLAFEYKYLPEEYLSNMTSSLSYTTTTEKNIIFNKNYLVPIISTGCDYIGAGSINYCSNNSSWASFFQNKKWPISATEAVGSTPPQDSYVLQDPYFFKSTTGNPITTEFSQYNWPGTYHARDYVILNLKEPSVPEETPETPPVTPPGQPQESGLMILYDSNIVDNPPPGFSDLIAPNWGERVP